jgi:hypothetical protein
MTSLMTTIDFSVTGRMPSLQKPAAARDERRVLPGSARVRAQRGHG